MRLPFPIPMPERAELVADGMECVEAQAYSGAASADYQMAQSRLALVLSTIWRRYGVEDEAAAPVSQEELFS
jgi:hypothetical protein